MWHSSIFEQISCSKIVRDVHLWRQKHQTTTTTTTTTLNVCIPCSLTAIFVWFCNLVYIRLAVEIVQNSRINWSIYLNPSFTLTLGRCHKTFYESKGFGFKTFRPWFNEKEQVLRYRSLIEWYILPNQPKSSPRMWNNATSTSWLANSNQGNSDIPPNFWSSYILYIITLFIKVKMLMLI